MALDVLLALLAGNTDEAAGKYVQLQSRLVRLFIARGHSDPENLSDITINRVIEHVAEKREIANVEAYTIKVAQYVSLEQWKKKNPESLGDMDPEGRSLHHRLADETANREEQLIDEIYQSLTEKKRICMRRCFMNLPRPDRDLLSNYIKSRGWSDRERQRVSRLRAQLRVCAGKCVKS